MAINPKGKINLGERNRDMLPPFYGENDKQLGLLDGDGWVYLQKKKAKTRASGVNVAGKKKKKKLGPEEIIARKIRDEKAFEGLGIKVRKGKRKRISKTKLVTKAKLKSKRKGKPKS